MEMTVGIDVAYGQDQTVVMMTGGDAEFDAADTVKLFPVGTRFRVDNPHTPFDLGKTFVVVSVGELTVAAEDQGEKPSSNAPKAKYGWMWETIAIFIDKGWLRIVEVNRDR